MNNVIHAEDRFTEKGQMEHIDFQLWRHDRYWLGMDVQKCTDTANAAAMRCGDPPYSEEKIDRLERLYMKWLIQRGDEVADRR